MVLACNRADLHAITGATATSGGDTASTGGAGGATSRGGAGGADAQGGGGASGRGGTSTTTGGAAGTGGSAGAGGEAGAGGSAGAPSLCSTPTLEPGDETRDLEVGGVARSYVLHVPPSYDGTSRVPLVVDFHGGGRSGEQELADSPYRTVLDPEGVIMAFPDGLPGPSGAAWNVGPCCVEDVDDVAFARALVEDVMQTACIDPARVYAVGTLSGGGMAHYLGCHAADVFAAVAPAAFDLLEENIIDCVPARPITVISFRGNGGGPVPYEGGPSAQVPGMPLTFLGAVGSFEKWAELDGCTGTPSPADADGCSSYTDCEEGVEVVLCTQMGGNSLPGDAHIAWPVLQRHTL